MKASDIPHGASMVGKSAVEAHCEVCGEGEARYIFRKRGFHLYHCIHCGLAFVWPQPSDEQLAALYQRASGYFATARTRLETTSSESAEELLRVLARHSVSVGTVLDVGCANGQLLYHLGKAGWATVGVDINAEVAAIARENGVDVRIGEVGNADLPRGAFDAINLGDVLEHVRSPRAMMTAVFSLLRPGGVVVIRTPNASCSFARATLPLARAGMPWPHSEAPYHLFEFTPQSLRALLDSTGFAVEELRTESHRSFAYTVGATGFFDDLKRTIKASSPSRALGRLVLALPVLTGVACLLAPFHVVGRLLDLLRQSGDSIVVVGRRLV